MNIEKLKSGSYRVRKMVGGKRLQLVFDHRPTQKEITLLMAEKVEKAKEGVTVDGRITFGPAAERYVESIDGVHSPTTVREYDLCAKYIIKHYAWFAATKISDMSTAVVQQFVNEYAKGKDENCKRKIKTRSAKTVKNMYGFVRSVLKMYAPDIRLNVSLPKRESIPPYIPTDDDVRRVFAALMESDLQHYYVPLALAAMGMRRSEIAAADAKDLNGNTLFIHRAKVLDKDKNWIIKDYGKTPESTRYISIPSIIADMIRKQGYVYRGAPQNLTRVLHTAQDELGIPRFSVHKLRHFFASAAIARSVPIAYVQRSGGWKNDEVLKRIYIHVMEDKVKEIDSVSVNHLTSILS